MDICRRRFGACLLGGFAGSRVLALPSRPRLLVLIVVQQFRPEYLDAVGSQLGAGGFKRLLDKGAWFPDCRHAASTFPSATLATLATGSLDGSLAISAANERSLSVPATQQTVEPVTRTPLEVREGEDQHVIRLVNVDHRIGEAAAEVPPRPGAEGTVNARIGASFLNQSVHLGGKATRQCPVLPLIILGRRQQIGFRLGMQLVGLHDP